VRDFLALSVPGAGEGFFRLWLVCEEHRADCDPAILDLGRRTLALRLSALVVARSSPAATGDGWQQKRPH
jgi:hypothetical protein